MQTPLRENLHNAVADCVVIDCETTGLDPDRDRIIEVAAVRVVGGEPTQSFHSLVDPGRELPVIITELTGLEDASLRGSPGFAAIMGRLLELTASRTVVGHNVSFDIAFFNAEVRRHRGSRTIDPADALCTAETARSLIPRDAVGRYRLDTLADVLDLPHQPSHRAADDVLATIDLLTYLDTLPSREG